MRWLLIGALLAIAIGILGVGGTGIVMTRGGYAFMGLQTSGSMMGGGMMTVAPRGTSTVGLARPAILKLMSGLPSGLPNTVRWTSVVSKVIRLPPRPTVAPLGTWSPNDRA
ncbi:MAG: hypothetical protein DLM67_12585 [Candidatus Nephthysia bennettiae]|nr:MAG: hypothetical protein DLM67_12585 [Candidatus Dormibacteraeota bacterium]